MSSMTQWASLLGLPLEAALERARAAGVEPEVHMTREPRQGERNAQTLRVIRVCGDEERLSLVVSAFMDGDPRKA